MKNQRPYIICHMTTSVDGKVTGDFLSRPDTQDAIDEYYRINRDLRCDGYICGRVTMEGSFTGGYYPDLTEFNGVEVPDGDFIAEKNGFYAVAFDRRGRLGWQCGKIEDSDPGYDSAHMIEVLNTADKRYLAYLRSIGVSYIFAGKDGELDVEYALLKLKELFGIEKLLLEGGSIINGAFLQANCVDELSLVVAPVTADEDSMPLFSDGTSKTFSLKKEEHLGKNILHLQYDLC